jgi:hypothetical protein
MKLTTKFFGFLIAATLSACGGGSSPETQPSQTRLLASTSTSTTPVSDYSNLLQKIYVGYFGRPADPAGLAWFAGQYQAANLPTTLAGVLHEYDANNQSAKGLLDMLGTSEESRALYPGENAVFVNAVYKNLFNRSAEPAGLAFWTSVLDNHQMVRATAALSIMSGALGTDLAIIDKKAAVATAYSNSLNTKEKLDAYSGMAANEVVRAMLGRVDWSTDVGAFQSSIDAANAALANGGVTPPVATQRYLGTNYLADNGLQVRIDSVVVSDQGSQYKNYTVTYTQTNNTSLAVDEAILKLYFANDAPLPQYGFFDRVYPGIPVTRTYTFTQLATSVPSVLEYAKNNFFSKEPIVGSLQWTFPIVAAPSGAGSLALSEASFFGDSPLTLPYSSTVSFNNSVVGLAYTTIGDYKLAATGRNYTIANVVAKDASGTVVPYFNNLQNGKVIVAGTPVAFSLRLPLTGGRPVSLTYSFSIAETGQTFVVNATGKTN